MYVYTVVLVVFVVTSQTMSAAVDPYVGRQAWHRKVVFNTCSYLITYTRMNVCS